MHHPLCGPLFNTGYQAGEQVDVRVAIQQQAMAGSQVMHAAQARFKRQRQLVALLGNDVECHATGCTVGPDPDARLLARDAGQFTADRFYVCPQPLTELGCGLVLLSFGVVTQAGRCRQLIALGVG